MATTQYSWSLHTACSLGRGWCSNRALDSQGGAEKLQFNISPLRPLLLSKTEYKPKKRLAPTLINSGSDSCVLTPFPLQNPWVFNYSLNNHPQDSWPLLSVSCSELFVMKQEEVMTIVEQIALFFISTHMFNPLLLSIFSHYIILILSKNNATKVPSKNVQYDLWDVLGKCLEWHL